MTLAVAVAWVSAAAAQGLYWESTTSGIGTAPRTAQFYAVPQMMKIVQSDGHVVIVHSDDDKLISIDTKKQSYHEMHIAQLEGAAHAAQGQAQGQMDAVRAQMEQRMKDLPPEQRAMMEKMMPNMPGAAAAKPAAVSVKNTGETKSIAGYACTKYVATQGDTTVLVAWTTKDVKGLEGLHDDWLKFQKRMSAMNRLGPSGGVGDAYAQIDGFPMETEMGPVKTMVTKVEARTTPASEFQVPSGYKQETLNLPGAP
ncbi:MAG: DUF4412 domain-containing protein [Candidatus Binatia bacterium]